MKLQHRVIVLLGLSTLLLGGCAAINPLWRDDEDIHTWISRKTPTGCTTESVQDFVQKEHWHNENRIPPMGLQHCPYCQKRNQFSWRFKNQEVKPGLNWVSASASYNSYDLLPPTYVMAYWGFDTNKLLSQIWVEKHSWLP